MDVRVGEELLVVAAPSSTEELLPSAVAGAAVVQAAVAAALPGSTIDSIPSTTDSADPLRDPIDLTDQGSAPSGIGDVCKRCRWARSGADVLVFAASAALAAGLLPYTSADCSE